MNIWKRLGLLEQELNRKAKSLDRAHEKLNHILCTIGRINASLDGQSRFRGPFEIVGELDPGILEKHILLAVKVKQQGDFINQLAALHGKAIADPVKSEFGKVLVDADET